MSQLSIFPSIVVEHIEKDGGIVVSVAPAMETPDGGFDTEVEFTEGLEKEVIEEMMVNTLASGLATAILKCEDTKGTPGKVMARAMEQLNSMYVSTSSEIVNNEKE
jgi:hypothetical protein